MKWLMIDKTIWGWEQPQKLVIGAIVACQLPISKVSANICTHTNKGIHHGH
ncbi:hypothetical protein VCR26J2_370327 [Vibrio coralliirubri]|nr:hypothetical protein VCR26J2_370327 [Vibrio coralliirubri]